MVDKLGILKHRYEIDKSLSLPSEMREREQDLMRNIDDVNLRQQALFQLFLRLSILINISITRSFIIMTFNLTIFVFVFLSISL